jgi:Na+/proline symporter
MVGSWAASGAVLGILLGALWVPRSIAAGFLAGLAAGALVRLLWNASGANPDGAFQDSVGIGIECLLIVGLVVASLQLLNAQPRPGHAARAAPGH